MDDQAPDSRPDNTAGDITPVVEPVSEIFETPTGVKAPEVKHDGELADQPIPAETEAENGPVSFKLRLRIEDAGATLAVTLTDEAIIGRRDAESNEAPDIDLTSLGGYQRGISRNHAALHVQDNQVCLTDLGSHNGTYLNGHRIPTRQTALVSDGDEMRLGQVVLHITIEPV
jgi:pSer/pThr/pTyr-binding forkhead associated (FHA) protein